jgi:hypothetical protein
MRVWDDILGKETEDAVEGVLTDNRFDWYLMPFTVAPEKILPKTSVPIFDNHPNFYHSFYTTENGGTRSKLYYMIIDKILEPFCKKTGIKVKKILRIRANLLTNLRDVPIQHHTMPHLDRYDTTNDTNFMVLIYYVNDSDGPTFVFPEATEPKKGRFLLFKNTNHAGSYPIKNSMRIVINFNLICDS